jgi:hypothetical protein
LIKDCARPNLGNHVLWCLGRLGARVPLYGPANTTLPRETAERWLEALLARTYAPGRESTDAVFALGQLARVSLDRARDVGSDTQSKVLATMATLGASADELRPVREFAEFASAEQGVALGDTLPVGLRLVGQAESAEV